MKKEMEWYDVYLQSDKERRPYERNDVGAVVFGSSVYKDAKAFFEHLKVEKGMVKLLYKNNKLLLEGF